jgi:hypothetical protein
VRLGTNLPSTPGRTSIAALVAAWWLLAAATPTPEKVYIDYDRKASLTRYKTYAIAEPSGDVSLAQRAPIAHRHLLKAMKKRIDAGGRLTETATDPDVYVTYRVASTEETDMSTTEYATGPGWSGGSYWAGVGWGAANDTVTSYAVGTLVIDIWDAEAKRAVWRGIADGVVPSTPEKGFKKIDAALDKLVEKWHSMRAEGK